MGKLLADGSDEGDHLDTSTDEPSPSDDPTTALDYDLGAYQPLGRRPGHDPDHPPRLGAHSGAGAPQGPGDAWLETYAYMRRPRPRRAHQDAGRARPRARARRRGDARQRRRHGELVLAQKRRRAGWAAAGSCTTTRATRSRPTSRSSTAARLRRRGRAGRRGASPRSPATTRSAGRSASTTPTAATAPSSSTRGTRSPPTRTTPCWTATGTARAAAAALGDDQANAARPRPRRTPTRPRRATSTRSAGRSGRPPTTALAATTRPPSRSTSRATAHHHDALGRTALTQDYDMTGAEIHTSSIDARRALAAAGCRRPAAARLGQPRKHRRPRLRRAAAPDRPARADRQRPGGSPSGSSTARRSRMREARTCAAPPTALRRGRGGDAPEAGLPGQRHAPPPAARRRRGEIDWSEAAGARTPRLHHQRRRYDALNRPITVSTPDGA